MSSTDRSDWPQIALITLSGVGGVCGLFRWPIAAAAVFAVLLAHTLHVWNRRSDRFVAVAAVFCGLALELPATGTGLWQYAHTTLAGLPAWVPMLWPVYMLGLPHLAATVVPGPDGPLARPRIAVVLGVAIVIAVVLLLAGFGNRYPILVTFALVIVGAIALAVAPSRRTMVVLLTSAAFGFVCESLPVRLGIWSYPAFGLSAMPPWLAPGYALFGLGTVYLGQGLDGLLRRDR